MGQHRTRDAHRGSERDGVGEVAQEAGSSSSQGQIGGGGGCGRGRSVGRGWEFDR